MCRQYLTIYEWCKCREVTDKVHCAGHRRGGCVGIKTETTHMQCFCTIHATTSWISEKKAKKKMKEKNGRKWYKWHAK